MGAMPLWANVNPLLKSQNITLLLQQIDENWHFWPNRCRLIFA